jgi:uncharacterized protein (TIRG00374 family)
MRRLIALSVSLAFLALLYAFVDVRALIEAMRTADPWWLVASLALVVPITLATAWRFLLLVRDAKISFGEANRLILASSTLNLFLPSKMGDLAKAFVLTERHGMSGRLSLSIVIFEKSLDMFSLLLCGVAALIYVGVSNHAFLVLLIPVVSLLIIVAVLILPLPLLKMGMATACRFMPAPIAMRLDSFAGDLKNVVQWFWSRRLRAFAVIVLSLALWFIHLGQFWLFTRAVGGTVPLIDNMAFATLSILVGLLPFTLAGIGSRDAAIVVFYAAYLAPAAGALVGILATLRYVLPALAGLPFVGAFVASAAEWRQWAVAEGAREVP